MHPYRKAVRGALVAAVALWAFAAFTNVDAPGLSHALEPDCGTEPAWSDHPSDELVAEWYAYGDCSGYYGPIDAEGVDLPPIITVEVSHGL